MMTSLTTQFVNALRGGAQSLLSFFRYVVAIPSAIVLVWRFQRLLWHGKRYFDNAEQNGPEFRRLLVDSGPLYIKIGQWLSQRPDLLPRAFLQHLKSLQYDAPAHDFEHTMACLRAAFEQSVQRSRNENAQSGERSGSFQKSHDVNADAATTLPSNNFDDVFATIDPIPLASASIAQVHRVVLRLSPASPLVKEIRATTAQQKQFNRQEQEGNEFETIENETEDTSTKNDQRSQQETLECVAKVRHPNVQALLDRDLRLATILFNVGRFFDVPFTRIVDVESVFEEMRWQCRLSNEIAPMKEFCANFAHAHNVTFPKPVEWCYSDDVVIETRVHGVRYEQLPPSNERASVRDLCKRLTMGAFMQMVFLDGLIHGDCHGGNVLYRVSERAPGNNTHEITMQEKRGERKEGEEKRGERKEGEEEKSCERKAREEEKRDERREENVHPRENETKKGEMICSDMYQGETASEVFSCNAQVAFVDFGVTARVSPTQKHAFIELLSGGFSMDVQRCVKTIRHLVIDGNTKNRADGNASSANGSGNSIGDSSSSSSSTQEPRLSIVQEAGLQAFEHEFGIVLRLLETDVQSSVGRMLSELLALLQRYELRIDGNLVRIIVNFILIEEDYGYGKFNNVFDNTMRYVLYDDESRDFEALIDPISDFFANHYAVRHGVRAPASRELSGTDESMQSLGEISNATTTTESTLLASLTSRTTENSTAKVSKSNRRQIKKST